MRDEFARDSLHRHFALLLPHASATSRFRHLTLPNAGWYKSNSPYLDLGKLEPTLGGHTEEVPAGSRMKRVPDQKRPSSATLDS